MKTQNSVGTDMGGSYDSVHKLYEDCIMCSKETTILKKFNSHFLRIFIVYFNKPEIFFIF